MSVNFIGEKRKMQFAKSKYAAISIAIFLIVSIGASMLLIAPATAHTPPYKITTYAKVVTLPDPIGVGQRVYLYAFLGNPPLPGSAIVNTYRFHNYTITLTDPNGKVETFYYETVQDTTGVQSVIYTPTIVGTYNVTFVYGEQTIRTGGIDQPVNSTNENDIYLPSTATTTMTVLSEPIFNLPDSYPLPTEYWTRPVYGENPYWFTVASNWLGTGSPVNPATGVGQISGIPGASMLQRYPGDAVGSMTNHVMWAKGSQVGGVVGGNNFINQGDAYFSGSAYIQRFDNPLIVNGKLIYTQNVGWGSEGSTAGPTSYGPTVALDLRTGQTIWSRTDVPVLSFAYIYNVQTPNQHGVAQPILFTSNFARAFDADTGQPLFNVSSVPSGSAAMGPSGEQLRYVLINTGNSTVPKWVLAQWNSSKLWVYEPRTPGGMALGPALYNSTTPYLDIYTSSTTNVAWTNVNGLVNGGGTFTVQGNVFNSASIDNRYDWNVSMPLINTMPGTNPVTVLAALPGDVLLCRNGSYPSLTGQTNSDGSIVNANYTYFAINLNASKGVIGSILWSATYAVPQDRTITFGGADPVTDIFLEGIKESANFNGFDLRSGAKLWGPNQPEASLDYFGNPAYPYVSSQIAYGNIYSLQYGGLLYCYDIKTGNLLWTYGNGGAGNNTNSGLQVPGYYPGFINAVGNGVIYTVTTEHTIETPIYKGAMARAINATDGTEIWTINAYTSEFFQISYAMADGYNTFFNDYDARVYTVGRGPSQTTVSAPSISSTFGTPVVISGIVTDISAGTKQDEQAARFPTGVPVASDKSMSDWMGYIYQQKPLPTNFTGVDVAINVVDANGNFRTIGTTTTDKNGQYTLLWQPDISGKYQVTANFAGTHGYYPSSATAAFNVMEQAATTTPTPAPGQSMVEQLFIPAVIGIILASVIVGVVIVLILRKRP